MKNIKIIDRLLLVTAFLFTLSCSSPDSGKASKTGELRGKISISGAFALYPMGVKWAIAHECHPGKT
jgi:ABC-type phosphate transport system substrate-binding protein